MERLLIFPKNSSESVRDWVQRVLLYNLTNLNLLPGKILSEKEVADYLKVSRTPVREAFIYLAQEELLEIRPQKGTYVSLIDLDHVEEARYMRKCLEKPTVVLACRVFSGEDCLTLQANLQMEERAIAEKNYIRFYELDEELHRILFYGCGLSRIWEHLRRMNSHFNRLRMLSLFNTDWNRVLNQHRQMVVCIERGDAEGAENVMEEHLNKVTFDLTEMVRDYPEYFRPEQRDTLLTKRLVAGKLLNR